MTSASEDTVARRPSDPDEPRTRPWAARLAALAERVRAPLAAAERDRTRAELWLLLSAALARYARAQRHGLGPLSREDLEDLVAAKSLDLVTRIESGALVLRRDSDHDVAAFVAQTSRNAIIDHLRRDRVRQVDAAGAEARLEAPNGASPSDRVEFAEVAAALEQCVAALAPRARRVWIFRSFFDMSSRAIAGHPDVGISPANVDVVLGRARTALRACLEKRGLDASHTELAGVARLWDRFVRSESPEGTGK